MMLNKPPYKLGPFVLITFIYAIVGFLTTINGQLQGPLQVAFLSQVEELRNTLITLIPFSFFLGYLVNSSLGGKWIDRAGYKSALIKGLLFMILGVFAYLLSVVIADKLPAWDIELGTDYVPYSFFIFLLGAFLTGSSAAILQVVINPYVTSYELPNTQPVQRLNIVCAINSYATMIAPFFVTGVMFAGVAIGQVRIGQLIMPLGWMLVVIMIITFVTSRLHLPDIEGTHAEKGYDTKASIWSFSHLKWGVITIFFYVGAEVAIGVNVNLYAISLIESGVKLSFFGHQNISFMGLDLGIPALLATLYWGGLMVGRSVSSFLSHITERTQLVFTAITAIILIIIAIISQNLWVLVSVGLCHSIMWAAIFSLAVKDLKEYTSKASGVFMMGVFGGAVFPLIQGYLADTFGSWQWTWILIILCECMIFFYAIIGSRIRRTVDSKVSIS